MCATPTGLFVSDDAGAGWRTYTTADGLLSDDVRDIGFDGSVTWILTDAGVSGAAVDSDSLLYLGSFTEENSAGGLPSDDTRAVLVGGDWVHVGTAGGVGRCTHDECAHWWVVQEADESVRALSLDALDNIWAATDGGLAWNELGGFWGDWASLPGLSGVPVRAVASGAPGSAHACLTYAATPQGLYAVDTDGVRERYEYGHGLPSDDLTDVFIDAEGVVWLATGAGVVRVDTELVPAGPDRAPATCEQPLRCWEGSTWSDPCRHAPTVSAWQGSCGGRGPEAVLEFEAPEDGTWVFDTDGSDFDTLLYVRTACTEPASELECDDDGGGAGSSSRAEAWLNEGQVVYVFVDGYFAFSSGTWVLNVSQ